MKIITREELIAAIDKFLKKKNINAHEFGKNHFNDSGLVPRLKEGRDPRLSTVIKIMKIVAGSR